MEPMMRIINALAALTAALQEYTAQTTEGYINTFEEIYTPDMEDAPTSEQQPAPAPTVTIEEVRSVLSELTRAGKMSEGKALLQKHGAERLGAVDPLEYPALLKEAGELNA